MSATKIERRRCASTFTCANCRSEAHSLHLFELAQSAIEGALQPYGSSHPWHKIMSLPEEECQYICSKQDQEEDERDDIC